MKRHLRSIRVILVAGALGLVAGSVVPASAGKGCSLGPGSHSNQA